MALSILFNTVDVDVFSYSRATGVNKHPFNIIWAPPLFSMLTSEHVLNFVMC